MLIRRIGHAAFHIETNQGLKLRTDPYDKTIGLPISDLPADVVTVSHEHFDHNAADLVPGKPQVLKGPQNVVIKGAAIRSVASFHDDADGTERGPNAIFVVEADGIVFAHLGDLGHMLSEAQLDELGPVDVLCIPVGGNYTLGPDEATELMNTIQPLITIPMHYRIEGLGVNIAPVEAFLEDKPRVREADEIDVTPKTLPAESEIVVLHPRP